jgi:hypothetical protein
MTHYVDWKILIIEVPQPNEHERSHRKFSDKLVIRSSEDGIRRREFDSLGTTTFKTSRVSKEGDSVFKPLSTRLRKADWPTIVLSDSDHSDLRTVVGHFSMLIVLAVRLIEKSRTILTSPLDSSSQICASSRSFVRDSDHPDSTKLRRDAHI